jgi:hypothetical protein
MVRTAVCGMRLDARDMVKRKARSRKTLSLLAHACLPAVSSGYHTTGRAWNVSRHRHLLAHRRVTSATCTAAANHHLFCFCV